MISFEQVLTFFQNNGFAFEMLLSNIMFVYRLEKRSKFLLRAFFSFLFFMLVVFLWSFFNTRFTIWDMPKFMMLVFLAVLILMFCFKISWRTAIFCEISAFATQHSAYKFGELIQSFAEIKLGLNLNILIYIITLPLVYLLYYILFAKNLKKYDVMKFKNNQIILLSAALMLIAIVLGQYSYKNDYSIYIMLALYDILCCLLTLSCQYSILKNVCIGEEASIMEQMLFLQKKQMKSSKETIDILNIKFHDLKHQLTRLEDRISPDELKELKEAISMYDLTFNTGNEALDIILAEKAFKCWKNNIKMNCIADGKSLSFMRPSDIYSLFGNAIDNAVEAVQKLENFDKRVISINVKKTMGMVSMHFENYYQGNINILDELPQTTKNSKSYHGFGMKSIKMIAEKYGGYISFNTSDSLFQLNIILPEKLEKIN